MVRTLKAISAIMAICLLWFIFFTSCGTSRHGEINTVRSADDQDPPNYVLTILDKDGDPLERMPLIRFDFSGSGNGHIGCWRMDGSKFYTNQPYFIDVVDDDTDPSRS